MTDEEHAQRTRAEGAALDRFHAENLSMARALVDVASECLGLTRVEAAAIRSTAAGRLARLFDNSTVGPAKQVRWAENVIRGALRDWRAGTIEKVAHAAPVEMTE